MSRQNVLWALLDLVFLVVFNVVFFVMGGTQHPPSVWLSYAFIHFAYLMVLVTPWLTRKGRDAAVFGFALYSVAGAYFILELVVGVIFILLAQDDFKIAFVVQVVLAGLFLALLLSHLIANEKTADAVAQSETEVAFVKTAAERLHALLGATGNAAADKAIERAWDVVRTSPAKSSASAQAVEGELLDAVGRLETAVAAKDAAAAIDAAKNVVQKSEERARLLRLAR